MDPIIPTIENEPPTHDEWKRIVLAERIKARFSTMGWLIDSDANALRSELHFQRQDFAEFCKL